VIGREPAESSWGGYSADFSAHSSALRGDLDYLCHRAILSVSARPVGQEDAWVGRSRAVIVLSPGAKSDVIFDHLGNCSKVRTTHQPS